MKVTNIFVGSCICLSMLTACSYSPNLLKHASSESLVRDLAEAQCCASVDDMNINTLDSQSGFFTLRENDQKLQIDGNSYPYRAYEVPDGNGEQHFKLTSFFYDNENEKKISLPLVLILNEDRTVSRMSGLNMLDYRNRNIYDSENFFLFIKLDKRQKPKEKYIVIISESKIAGETLDYQETARTSSMPVIAGNNLIGMMPVEEGGHKLRFVAVPYGNYKFELITNPLSKPFDSFVHF